MSALLEQSLNAITSLRQKGARVHCITNTVVQNLTANVLLACNATPSMTVAIAEVEHFVAHSDALLVNMGTLDEVRKHSILSAMSRASELGLPTVLDPVMVHMSRPRLLFAQKLFEWPVHVLHANRREWEAIQSIAANRAWPVNVASTLVTGEVDEISTRETSLKVTNGSPMLGQVIGTGCALGAMAAALATHCDEPVAAGQAAVLWMSVAGEIAAGTASGPGTFSPLLLDALASVSVDTIRERASIS